MRFPVIGLRDLPVLGEGSKQERQEQQGLHIARFIALHWDTGRMVVQDLYKENADILKDKGYTIDNGIQEGSLVAHVGPVQTTISWDPAAADAPSFLP